MNRLAVPAVRIFAAAVILITGAGVSAVFWKMPKNTEPHALYHEGVAGKELAAVPLPNGSVAAISLEEMRLIDLPTFDLAPVADEGAEKYAQVYPAPASLAIVNAKQGEEEGNESFFTPVIPQIFEPMREIIEEKPIAVEPFFRDFLPMPESVSTTERSDELHTTFHFVENSKAGFGNGDLLEQPVDPFSERPADSFPIAAAPVSALQPLQPIQFERLSPLLPLREIEL